MSQEERTSSSSLRFEALADGTFYGRAGVQTNCAGIAGIHVRVAPSPSGELVFLLGDGGGEHEVGYGPRVPGSAVPEELRDAVQSGAREALEEHGRGMGLRLELLDALVLPVDANPRMFKIAGATVVREWLARHASRVRIGE